MASAIGKLNKSDSVSFNKNQEDDKKYKTSNKILPPQQSSRYSFTQPSPHSSQFHKFNEYS